MMQKEPYILVEDWMLQEVGAGTSVLVYALLHSLAAASDDGIATASIRYMCERVHVTKNTIKATLQELQEKQLITITNAGNGRGNVSRYIVQRKGSKIDPIKKGQKMTPLDKKRGQNSPKKGSKIDPNNKENKNNNNNTRARVLNVVDVVSSFSKNEGERDALDKDMNDYGFNEFWQTFAPAAEFENRRMACLNAWAGATRERRNELMQVLRDGAEHQANPLFFINYHTGTRPADVELLTFAQVMQRFRTSDPKGWCVLEPEYEGAGARWCKTDVAVENGYKIKRIF